jgi:hypothetical protein
MLRKRPPKLSEELLARLAGGFILSSRKGKPYLKRYASPRNPKTPRQRSARLAFARAVHAWQAADPTIKARWNEAARNTRATGYNLFIQEFLARDRAVPD